VSTEHLGEGERLALVVAGEELLHQRQPGPGDRFE
jgi:hypothetical protein